MINVFLERYARLGSKVFFKVDTKVFNLRMFVDIVRYMKPNLCVSEF